MFTLYLSSLLSCDAFGLYFFLLSAATLPVLAFLMKFPFNQKEKVDVGCIVMWGIKVNNDGNEQNNSLKKIIIQRSS